MDHLTVGKAAIDHFQYLADYVKALMGGKKFKPSIEHCDFLGGLHTQQKGRPCTDLLVRGGDRIERDGGGKGTTALQAPRIKESFPKSYQTDLYQTDLYRTDKSDFELERFVLEQLDKVRTGVESSVKSEMRKKDEEITRLKMQISSLEKKLQAKETESEDRGFRLSLLENVSYDGTMIWKIPQFAQRMVDAQSGKYTSIFSLPFYTSRYGYKLCLRLYILGDGIGKGTHMSLFFVVMRGEFDNILQWPFTHKVTFRLLNQSGGKDIVDGFLPDSMSSSFSRPKTDMNVASGCPRFVPISELNSGGFIVDDTVFIKVKVDTSGIKQ